MGRKRQDDALTIVGDHRGTPITLRLVDPPLRSSSSRNTLASAPFIRRAGATKIKTTTHGFIVPARLVVEGLAHPIEFTVAPVSLGLGVGITSLTVHKREHARLTNESVPLISNLTALALRLLSCRVEVTPRNGQGGGRVVSLNAALDADEMLVALGQPKKSAEGKAIQRSTNARIARLNAVQRRRDRGEQPHWDDPQTIAALRKAVAALPPLSQRRPRQRHEWVRDELAEKYRVEFTAETVRKMMSKHGLTKKRGKK